MSSEFKDVLEDYADIFSEKPEPPAPKPKITGVTVNMQEKIVYVNKPMTAIELHRTLSDIMDAGNNVVFDTPTSRVTDSHILMINGFRLQNKENITRGSVTNG